MPSASPLRHMRRVAALLIATGLLVMHGLPVSAAEGCQDVPPGGMERVASFAPALDRTPASMVTALPLLLGGELSGSHHCIADWPRKVRLPLTASTAPFPNSMAGRAAGAPAALALRPRPGSAVHPPALRVPRVMPPPFVSSTDDP
jgi:hypothetical protein